MEPGEKEIMRSNLHWYAYLGPVSVAILSIGLLQYFLNFKHPLASIANPISLLIFLIVLYRVLYDSRKAWILTNQRLYIVSGLFPWQKGTYYLHYNQIFEMYFRQSLAEKAMNYGTVTLRKSDGLGSVISQAYLNRARDFVGLFETSKNALQNPAQTPAGTSTGESIADQLEKLARLKTEGHISESEFQVLKSKLLA